MQSLCGDFSASFSGAGLIEYRPWNPLRICGIYLEKSPEFVVVILWLYFKMVVWVESFNVFRLH